MGVAYGTWCEHEQTPLVDFVQVQSAALQGSKGKDVNPPVSVQNKPLHFLSPGLILLLTRQCALRTEQGFYFIRSKTKVCVTPVFDLYCVQAKG